MKKAHELVSDSDQITEKRLKQKLKEKYCDHINFNEVRDQRNVTVLVLSLTAITQHLNSQSE